MALAMAAGILLLAAGIVTIPFFGRESLAEAESAGANLALERDRIFRALRELEYDRAMGKVGAEDYAALSERYTAQAVRLLKEEVTGHES